MKRPPAPTPAPFQTINRETLDFVTGGQGVGRLQPSQLRGYADGIQQQQVRLGLGESHGVAGLGGKLGGK